MNTKDTFKRIIPDSIYLKIVFKRSLGYKLNLRNPKSFNEKLQWLKLYNRNPLYTKMVDKYAVKEIISNCIGTEYVIPTIGVWDSFDKIDFNRLPSSFVLKTTHDSGGVVIVKDRAKFNKEEAKRILTKSLGQNFYYANREWPYKHVKPRIIAEPYMEDKLTGELRDYKFFTFDGKVKAMFIASDRQNPDEDTKFDFFDENFKHLNFTNGHPNAKVPPAKPENFELMKQLASKLGQGIPEVRIDFYECNGKVYFGEMTFFHWSGLVPFEPIEWDYKFGSWISLPINSKK